MNKRRSIAYRANKARHEQLIETIDLTLDSPVKFNDQNVTIRKTSKAAVQSRNIQEILCCCCDALYNTVFCVPFRNCPHQRCIQCQIQLIKCSKTVRVECSICKEEVEDDEIRCLLTQQEYSIHINKQTIFTELMELEEQSGYIQCPDEFECEICTTQIDVGDGMIIRNCLHHFCIDCIRAVIIHGTEAQVRCPAAACEEEIQDREIRSLVTQKEYDEYSIRMLKIVESQCSKSYHCKKPDCEGWAIVEDDVIFFGCPICSSINCLSCRAIHPGMNCLEYQKRKWKNESDEAITYQALQDIVQRGLGMQCPKCKILIMKRDGCDWLRCAMCKTEICWATKQSRWGPSGRGDTSGGCKCSILQKCSPLCNTCH